MHIAVSQIDAFTTRPFAGNPAAVCVLDCTRSQAITTSVRQQIAAEMNLAETAFVELRDSEIHLRWFTPKVEVDLCGHATLAAAFELWSSGRIAWSESIVFQSRSGPLICNAHRTREDRYTIQLDFPALPFESIEAPAGLLQALGVTPLAVVRSSMDHLIELADESAVLATQPDFAALARVPTRGVIVTAASSGNFDFVSRFFAPAVGIQEDPVTGSAHCLLGPYWQAKLGKSRFAAYQASERGGEIGVSVVGQRVHLLGSAVKVLQGELLLPES